MTEDLVQKLSPQIAPEGAKDMSAPCPKCRAAMVYVTALPHPNAPDMRRTVFLCPPCNQTRNYSLSAAMAEAYAALFGLERPRASEPMNPKPDQAGGSAQNAAR